MQGRFIFANGAVARGMGVSDPAELIGKTDFDFYPRELAIEYNRQEQEVLRHGRALLNQEEHASYLLLEKEGRPQKRSATPIAYKVSQCPKKFRTNNSNLKSA